MTARTSSGASPSGGCHCLLAADRTECDRGRESDSSREPRSTSERSGEFGSAPVMRAYRTQGALCPIPVVISSGWAVAVATRTLGRHCSPKEPVFVPVRLFTDAERERLNRFPRDISPADLLAFFTLS